jgi:hypothetical protein
MASSCFHYAATLRFQVATRLSLERVNFPLWADSASVIGKEPALCNRSFGGMANRLDSFVSIVCIIDEGMMDMNYVRTHIFAAECASPRSR